jgi:transcriptional antiterminator NusG
MIADHPTENVATDLAMPAEPAGPDSEADHNSVAAVMPPSLSVGVSGAPDDAEPGVGAALVESAAADGAGPGELAGLTDEPAEIAAAAETADDAVMGESEAGSLELELPDASTAEEELKKDWYILKVQVNREDSIRDALLRRVKIEGLEKFFGDIIIPTEEVAEFNKSGKRRVVRRKLYPGYILVHMAINDDTWFLVRETPGVGDFTGSAGKPTPMEARDVERILRLGTAQEERGGQIKTAIPFKSGDRVRVKDGHFQNFEGEVDAIDEANGRITVMINIFNRSTPVELEHWQVESV